MSKTLSPIARGPNETDREYFVRVMFNVHGIDEAQLVHVEDSSEAQKFAGYFVKNRYWFDCRYSRQDKTHYFTIASAHNLQELQRKVRVWVKI